MDNIKCFVRVQLKMGERNFFFLIEFFATHIKLKCIQHKMIIVMTVQFM